MSDKIKYWLDLCDYDLITAEAMLNTKEFYSWIKDKL